MVISAAARAAAKIAAKAATTKAGKVKKITKAKVRKHVGSYKKFKDVDHAKVVEEDAVRAIDREGKQMDGTSYNMQKEYWQEMDNTEAAMNPGFVAKPFPADKSISKHTREASIHTFFGPAKTKPRGDVKLQVERYVEPRKTLQMFPKEKDPIPRDLVYDKKRNEYSYIDWEKGKKVVLTAEEANYGRGFSYGTPLYGKFKPGMGIIGTLSLIHI